MRQTWVETRMLHIMSERRSARRMSQGRLAEAVNGASGGTVRWTRATVAALENGRRAVLRIEEIAALCAVLEISLADWAREAEMPQDQLDALAGAADSADAAEVGETEETEETV